MAIEAIQPVGLSMGTTPLRPTGRVAGGASPSAADGPGTNGVTPADRFDIVDRVELSTRARPVTAVAPVQRGVATEPADAASASDATTATAAAQSPANADTAGASAATNRNDGQYGLSAADLRRAIAQIQFAAPKPDDEDEKNNQPQPLNATPAQTPNAASTASLIGQHN